MWGEAASIRPLEAFLFHLCHVLLFPTSGSQLSSRKTNFRTNRSTFVYTQQARREIANLVNFIFPELISKGTTFGQEFWKNKLQKHLRNHATYVSLRFFWESGSDRKCNIVCPNNLFDRSPNVRKSFRRFWFLRFSQFHGSWKGASYHLGNFWRENSNSLFYSIKIDGTFIT